MSVFDDFAEMTGGAFEVAKHNPVFALANIARHGIQGAYSAVTGNREGAVDHAAEATTGAVGMLGGGLPGLLMGAGGLVAKMATGDSHFPGVGKAAGIGANGIIDKIFGKSEGKKETSTSQAILGTLGTMAWGGLGPIGMIAGGGLGRAIGGLFD
jgi:hypothetical protein